MREQKITLNQSQLFHLQAPTLETRITRFYQLTQNSSTAIQYILATKVRQQLGAQEFKEFLKDLVRHLFLHTKATRTMKRFFHYFADYFMAPEFRALRLKLFPVRNFMEKASSLVRSLLSPVRPNEDTEATEKIETNET